MVRSTSVGRKSDNEKTPVTRRSRNLGKLVHFKEMPLDIFFEILSHLMPLDLLNISWTSRQFRTVLINEAHHYLWATAKANVTPRLPVLPAGLSEARYAHLVFATNVCFSCGGKRAQHCNYAMTVRYCAACWEVNVRRGTELGRLYETVKDDPVIYTLLPAHPNWKYTNSRPLPNNEPDDSFLVAEFETVVSKYVSLLHDTKARETFVSERQKYTAERYAFSEAMKQWEKDKYDEMLDAESKYEESIKAKLLELGYTPSDFPVFKFKHSELWRKWLTLVRKPRELTPKIWKRDQPRLEKLVTEWKECQKSDERDDKIDLRGRQLRDAVKQILLTAPVEDGSLPTFCEIRDIPEVQALFEEDDYNIPMTADRLSTAFPALQAHARRKKTALVKAVWSNLTTVSRLPNETDCETVASGLDLLPPHPNNAPVIVDTLKESVKGMEFGSEDILELASTLLHCGYCCAWDPNNRRVWSFEELAKHVHLEHADNYQFFPPKVVDRGTAHKVLRALSLPEDTRYNDVPGKILCACADFKVTSTFAELVSHILWRTDFYQSLAHNRYASACEAADIIIQDHHNFDEGARPCIQPLADGDNFEQPPLMTEEQLLIQNWIGKLGPGKVRCRVCFNGTRIDWRKVDNHTDINVVQWQAPEMDLEKLITHVKGIHRRKPTIDDAVG